ncbi:MAG: TetR family transcriptional regulator [Pseudomonadota bacterium]
MANSRAKTASQKLKHKAARALSKAPARPRSASQNGTSQGEGGARQQLLTAAKRLFARKGLSATTIRDISNEAGLNSSLISYYFDGKDGLYKECIKQIGTERLSVAKEILSEAESASEFRLRLKMFTENLFKLYLEDRESGLIIVREYDRIDSPAEEIFRNTFLRVFEQLHNFFKAAQERGLIDAEKDSFTMAKLFFGSLSSQMRLDHINEKVYGKSIKDSEERKKVLHHILDLFLPLK